MSGDYKPLEFDGRWLWHNAEHPLADVGEYPDHLPGAVHAALTGHLPKPDNVTALVKAYPSREAAVAALGSAMVARS